MLLSALIVLWRKGVPAYITAYRWQSWLLAAVTAVIGYFGEDRQLYWVAGALLLLKGIAFPALLRAMQQRFGAQPPTRRRCEREGVQRPDCDHGHRHQSDGDLHGIC